MDVDGTLTDGKMYIGANGDVMKAFDVKDGYAIHEMLPTHGIKPIIITSKQSSVVEYRARDLGVELVFQGVVNKAALLKKVATDIGVALDEIAYFGDDINDLDCIRVCGLGGCPADAIDEVKACVDFVSNKNGGSGAVRDFVEYIIRKSVE
jgi:3-deoxy-D-manno-octulosonate 8-phosphate phosphatase (KDO 8-P phosphatase)